MARRGGDSGKQSSSFHSTNLQVIPKTDLTRAIHHHFNDPPLEARNHIRPLLLW